jgi:superfamily I DNA and/or RNA helicase
VIVGDPRQLPPYVDEAIRNARLLEEYDLSPEDAKATLLDHLLERIPEYARVPLRQQHRMVRPIGDLVSQCFYDGELVSVRTEIDPNLSKLHAIPTPVSWFSTSKSRARAETPSGSSFKNFVECKAIDTLLHRLEFTAKKCRSSYSVAVLAGYAAQVEELRSRLARFRVNEHLMLEICSVDAFQGRDADIAVYSITRSNDEGEIGFLRERERLNVALSRGREALCIVGDHVFCEKVVGENPFSDVLRYMRQHPGECSITEVQT